MNIYTQYVHAYDREQIVLAVLKAQDADLDIESRFAKYEKMSESPYRFFRGTNPLFWADIADDWRLTQFGNGHTRTWIQGDAHVYNFGAFGTHEHKVLFGLDDFDDAIIADYQYDVWRMAISILLVLRETDAVKAKHHAAFVTEFAHAYLENLLHTSGSEVPRQVFTQKTTDGKLSKFLKTVEDKESRGKMLDKWTVEVEGVRRFDFSSEKLSPVSVELRLKLEQLIADEYQKTLQAAHAPTDAAHFTVLDVAQRLNAGTGSLGLNRYYVLIAGDSATTQHECILDIKQQPEPTPYAFLSQLEQAEYSQRFEHHAQAHAAAYYALAEHVDAYLGWLTMDGLTYSVRERSPFKEDFPVEELKKKSQFRELLAQWGKILATAHKRGAAQLYADQESYFFERQVARLTHKKHKAFCDLVAEVACRYAEQVQYDWQFFLPHQVSLAKGKVKL